MHWKTGEGVWTTRWASTFDVPGVAVEGVGVIGYRDSGQIECCRIRG